MSDISIRLRDVAKAYGKQEAVKRLDLDVRCGELFGCLVTNGVGKTTTIKMMTGLLEPTTGSIDIHDVNVWADPIQAKQMIAYVPDQPNLYPKLSGWEYLEFVASVFDVSPEDFADKGAELLHIFDLHDRADELIESYSHGMKQKIAICGALLHDPAVLFLDEPTVGLDPKSARDLKNILRERCDQGMTVFMTTHILEIAEQMCDRIVIIANGVIIALGTMGELRKQIGRASCRERV